MTPREKVAPSLDDLLRQAVETMKSWTPEQREAHFEAQKKAWVAAEMAFGDEGTRVITALASGSGDQLSGNPGILKSGFGDHSGDATNMIGSGDHAKLARLADEAADFGVPAKVDPAVLNALLAENAALRADRIPLPPAPGAEA